MWCFPSILLYKDFMDLNSASKLIKLVSEIFILFTHSSLSSTEHKNHILTNTKLEFILFLRLPSLHFYLRRIFK